MIRSGSRRRICSTAAAIASTRPSSRPRTGRWRARPCWRRRDGLSARDAFAATAATLSARRRAGTARGVVITSEAGQQWPVATPGSGVDAWRLTADGAAVVAVTRHGDDRQVWRLGLDDQSAVLLDRGNAYAVATDASGRHTVAASQRDGTWEIRGWPAHGPARCRFATWCRSNRRRSRRWRRLVPQARSQWQSRPVGRAARTAGPRRDRDTPPTNGMHSRRRTAATSPGSRMPAAMWK